MESKLNILRSSIFENGVGRKLPIALMGVITPMLQMNTRLENTTDECEP